MASVTITWHSHHDGHTCKVCEMLDGYSWTFEIGEGIPDSLDLSGYPVWTKGLGMSVHNDFGTCRCWFTWELDLSDLIPMIDEFCDRILQSDLIQEPSGGELI